jgi:hypothetical protein
MRSLLWWLLWRIVRNRAVLVARKRGVRRDEGGWLYQTDQLRIESFGIGARVSVPLSKQQLERETALVDDGSKYWRLVLWSQGGTLKTWKFGPWAKEIGQLVWRIKRYNRGR